MTEFDEKEIIRRAEIIWRISPTLDGTERAMATVRDRLINGDWGRRTPKTPIWERIPVWVGQSSPSPPRL
jgi:hypothetical protein